MAQHPNPNLNSVLVQTIGANGFTVSGSTATVTSTITDNWTLRQIENAASQVDHTVVLVAGALTIKPK